MVASWPPAAIGATRRFDRGPANDRNRRKPATTLATYECGIKRNAVSVEEIERHASVPFLKWSYKKRCTNAIVGVPIGGSWLWRVKGSSWLPQHFPSVARARAARALPRRQ